MRAKPKSTMMSKKLRAGNLIVLVESKIKHELEIHACNYIFGIT